jgi:hypothetical protein
MDMTNDRIREVVRELRALPSADRARACARDHPGFARAFPKLAAAVADDRFDLRFLDMMLSQRTRFLGIAGDDAAEKSIDKEVYDVLREAYVTPALQTKP